MRRTAASGHLPVVGTSPSPRKADHAKTASRRKCSSLKVLCRRKRGHQVLILLLMVGFFFTWTGMIARNVTDNVNTKEQENRRSQVEEMVESLLVASEFGNLQQELQRVVKRLETVTNDDLTIKDSSSATVIAMASGYGLKDYRRFVGSLRMTGYQGHIMLGMSPAMQPGVREYLESQKVDMKLLKYTNCAYNIPEDAKKDKEMQTCADPYPNIKLRWSRFPLARDWLEECTECTGPVLVTDFRDAFFQRDPFMGTRVTALQVFEEHHSMRTTHWLEEWPIRECKGVTYNEPVLCSGTTVGTRDAMLKYLQTMYDEMKTWISDPKCNFGINGDDQAIHNYLYYSGKLPFATAIPNRMGIVHTVGARGSIILQAHKKHLMATQNMTGGEADMTPFQGADGNNMWIGTEFDLTDEEGYFINHDGTRSRVVHQYDRFWWSVSRWLDKKVG